MSKESLDGSARLPAGCLVIGAAGTLAAIGTIWLCVAAANAPHKPSGNLFPAVAAQPKQKPDMHPSLSKAFSAGVLAGQVYKKSGRSKPTEREIDGFALRAVSEINPPDSMRGEAVSKFKSGFGWGWWQN